MQKKHWISIAGTVVALAIILVFLPIISSVAEKDRRSSCKNNQKQLGLAMILYRDNLGGAAAFPDANGSDNLLALFQGGVSTDYSLLVCPSSGDRVPTAADIRPGNTLATSYAAWTRRQPTRPGSDVANSADDLEGSMNHDDAIVILFADGHVEEVSIDDARLGPSPLRFGAPGTALEFLAN